MLSKQLLIVGLDCLGAELLATESLVELPTLARLASTGLSGPLESTLPPITVPAWTSMLTGRDPGELGIYGFRNRRSAAYGDLVSASSGMVCYPRLWDHVAAAGGNSIVVGVPQTSPAPATQGVLVSGFEAQDLDGVPYCHPPEFADEMRAIVARYRFDITSFRHRAPEEVLAQIYEMTAQRFALMEHLVSSRPWNFAMLCDIAPDRLHHCFWSHHDPGHPRYDPNSPYRSVIRRYYRFVDDMVAQLVARVASETAIMVVSDHGAKAMQGGVCINEILAETGWLVMRTVPSTPSALNPQQVDWTRTRAWGEGGYYARIFINVRGREPQGIVPAEERDQVRRELVALLETLPLRDGPTLTNQVLYPETIYRQARGLPPDLIVLFDDLRWRSLGTIGHGRTWLVGNDTGVDEANHARDGLFIFSGLGISHGIVRASILDVTPTALDWLGLTPPPDLGGVNWLGRTACEQSELSRENRQ